MADEDDGRLKCEGCGKQMDPEEVADGYIDGPELCAACARTPEQIESDRVECRDAFTEGGQFHCEHLADCANAPKCMADNIAADPDWDAAERAWGGDLPASA